MPVYVGVRLKVPKFQMQIYRFCSAGKQSGIGTLLGIYGAANRDLMAKR
jgi:hypothetical protein